MNGWIDGRRDGRGNGRTDGRVDGRTRAPTNGRTDGSATIATDCTDGYPDVRNDRKMRKGSARTDEWFGITFRTHLDYVEFAKQNKFSR